VTDRETFILKLDYKRSYFVRIIKRYFASYSGLPKQCWQGIGLGFVEATLVGVCFFLSLYFVNVLHFNIAMAGIIISFYGLGRVIGGLVGGKLSDTMPPELVSIGSLLVQAAAFFLLIKLKTFYFLIINLFILGVAAYGFIISNNVWVLNQCKHQELAKLKSLSMLHASSNLGIGLSALIVSVLSGYQFSSIFLLSGVLLFLSAIYLIYVERKKIYSESYVEEGVEQVSIQQTSVLGQNKKIVFMVLICLFFIGLIIAQLGTTYSIYLNNAFPSLGVSGVSILFALNSILIVVFQTPLVDFFGSYNKVLMIGVGAFLMGFGMFMLNFSFVFMMAIIACIIYTIGEMLFFSIAQLVCYQSSDEKKRGQSLGLFRMIFALSIFVGPATGGFIYHHLGANFVWDVCGIIGVACLMACHYYRKYG